MKKIVIFLFFGILALLVIASSFIDFPYYVRARGVVLPVEEWVLLRGRGGTLMHLHENHRLGIVYEYGTAEFQRGDIGKYVFNDTLLSLGFVNKGDTLAWVFTSDIYTQIISLQGELDYNKSLLAVYRSGEKPEEISLARNQIELALQELETQQLLTARNEVLYKQEVISNQEFELIVNDLKVKEFDVVIARSRLDALLSGRKSEEIRLVESKMLALETQMQQLQQHIDAFHLISPVTGQVIRERHFVPEFGEEVVLRIADLSSLVVSLPVDYHEEPYLRIGQAVQIQSVTRHMNVTGEIYSIDNTMTVVSNKPKVFVSVQVMDPPAGIVMRNMMVDAKVYCGSVGLMEYLRRISKTTYQN